MVTHHVTPTAIAVGLMSVAPAMKPITSGHCLMALEQVDADAAFIAKEPSIVLPKIKYSQPYIGCRLTPDG